VDDRFGLFIRTPDLKQGYLVGLTCDGRLSMTRWDGEETKFLVNFITSCQSLLSCTSKKNSLSCTYSEP
jgi:hypothetical protein